MRAIMALAATLKIAVASDGVETIDQAEFLREAGATLLQGQLFAKPMPLADMAVVVGAKPIAAAAASDQPKVGAVA